MKRQRWARFQVGLLLSLFLLIAVHQHWEEGKRPFIPSWLQGGRQAPSVCLLCQLSHQTSLQPVQEVHSFGVSPSFPLPLPSPVGGLQTAFFLLPDPRAPPFSFLG